MKTLLSLWGVISNMPSCNGIHIRGIRRVKALGNGNFVFVNLDGFIVVAKLDKSSGGTTASFLYKGFTDDGVVDIATFGSTNMAYSHDAGNIQVWDTSDRDNKFFDTNLEEPGRGSILAIIVSNKQHHLVDDGEFVVIVGTYHGQIECWNPELDSCLNRSSLYQTIQAHKTQITTLCELSNGRVVSGISLSQYDSQTDIETDSLLCLWDLSIYPSEKQEKGSPPQTPGVSFLGHTEGIKSVVELKPNETMASSGEDLTVRIWHVRDGVCLTVWNCAHIGIQLLKLKDNTLAIGSLDNTISRWWLKEEGDNNIKAELLSSFKCNSTIMCMEEVEPGLIVAGTVRSGEIWKVCFK